MKLSKFVIGVKPQRRMFRVTSLSGQIVDQVMDALGNGDLPDDYFTQALRSTDNSLVRLSDEKGVNSLRVDTESVIFTKDHYETKSRIDIEDALSEFQFLWRACQSVLHVEDVRRIGMVGEYRIEPSGNPSAALLRHLTQITTRGHVAKFHLQFESHALTTGDSGLPDVKSSDFWNTIETYYDSELDSERSREGEATAMLDIQRYYMPLLEGNIAEEIRKLKKRYDEQIGQVKDRLTTLDLLTQHRELNVAE
jgi:hypothetical protein